MKSINKNSINFQIEDFRKKLSTEFSLNVHLVRQTIVFCEHLLALMEVNEASFSLNFNDLHIIRLSDVCHKLLLDNDRRKQRAAQELLDFLSKAHGISNVQIKMKQFDAACQVSHLSITSSCNLLRCNT